MNRFFTYIFKNSEYQTIQWNFHRATSDYSKGLSIWKLQPKCTNISSFKFETLVSASISEIIDIDKFANQYPSFSSTYKDGLLLFLAIKGFKQIPNLTYDIYVHISKNISRIKLLHKLITTRHEAVLRFLGRKKISKDYATIDRITSSETAIENIHSLIIKTRNLMVAFPNAWNVLAKGRSFSDISTAELQLLSSKNCEIKEQFVKLLNSDKSLIIKSLLQGFNYVADSFSANTQQLESNILNWFNHTICINKDLFSFNTPLITDLNVHLDDKKELLYAILNSELHIDCPDFYSSCSIDDAYDLRIKFDNLGIRVSDAARELNKYLDAVKAFNLKKFGRSVVFFNDLYNILIINSDLYIFVQHWKEERQLRDRAKWIKDTYNKGFAYYHNFIDLDNCDIALIKYIIDSESQIASKDKVLCEEERIKLLNEQKKLEEQRIARDHSMLLDCVTFWHVTRYGFKHNYLFEYLKTGAPRDATEEEWYIRNLIWAFKDGPYKINKHCSYDDALRIIIPKYEQLLKNTFRDLISKLTLVCVPASSPKKNRLRWAQFSDTICSDLSMTNAYQHISVIGDAIPKRLGGDGSPKLHIDSQWFRNRFIVICDDIKTTGKSIANLKAELESCGATIICALTIGITIHE